MGKGGKCLQSAEMEIKDLQDWNHELQNKVEILEWKLKQSQTLINQMTSTLEAVKDFQIELEVKEKLIHSLQIKWKARFTWCTICREDKWKLWHKRPHHNNKWSCDTSDLIQHINEGCNIDDLIKQVDISCDTSDLNQPVVLLNDATSSTKDQIDQFDATCQIDELLMLDALCDTKGLINQGQNVSTTSSMNKNKRIVFPRKWSDLGKKSPSIKIDMA